MFYKYLNTRGYSLLKVKNSFHFINSKNDKNRQADYNLSADKSNYALFN